MAQPNEEVNDIGISQNDDSFDDEFRLLESTLTDFKEDDSSKDTLDKKHLNDSGTCSSDLVEITHSKSSNALTKDVKDSPRKREETELLPIEVDDAPVDLISSTNFQSPAISSKISKDFEIINAPSSSLLTTQHIKPTTQSTVSSSESLKFNCDTGTPNLVSNCDVLGLSGYTMQSSKLSKPLCLVQENDDINLDMPTKCNISVVDVAPCDSSFVESQEGTTSTLIPVLIDVPSKNNAEVELNVCTTVPPDYQELNIEESEKFKSNEDNNITILDLGLNKKCDDSVSCYIAASSSEIENKNLKLNQICKMSQLNENKITGDFNPENNGIEDLGLEQHDMKVQSIESNEEIMPLSPNVKHNSKCNLELKERSEVLTTDDKLEDSILTTIGTNKGLVDNDIPNKNPIGSDEKENTSFFCSTPIVSRPNIQDIMEDSEHKSEHTPLNTNFLKSKMNRKRANLCLERIDEEYDESTGGTSDKRLKIGSPTTSNVNNIVVQKNDSNVSLSMPCYEPPAKSILKKWHPSSLSRDSFLVLDECGDTDSEETVKPSQESVDYTSVMDDFEVACKSLAEELIMSSYNCEILEKYHSKVQLDSQMDDKKFDEVLQELTLNYEMDEKSFMSKMDQEESKFATNITNYSLRPMDESLNHTENKENPLTSVNDSSQSIEDKTILAERSINGLSNNSGANNCLSITHEDNSETTSASQCSKIKCENERVVTIIGSDEKLVMDEEDVLLEENVTAEQKNYVYFEYVSSDPKENEDNYNPEWQKLGKLTSDEERYKAVRDRWRSLVPPDPNRDLTCRQWRKKNNKPPLNLPSLNNNQRMFDRNEKNQLCTAVFERKIANILNESQMNRKRIINERNIQFEELAVVQDEQQIRVLMRGCNQYEMAMLQKRHIQECVMLKNRFDAQLDEIIKTTEQAVMSLKSACDEVLSFQKFYKGVGTSDRQVCMYMSDIQVEELMETEEMLDRYSKFYQ